MKSENRVIRLVAALAALCCHVGPLAAADPALDAEARWIGRTDFPSPAYGRVFTVDGEVRSARLEIAGLGFYEAWLNGRKVGDRVLEPCFTDYSRHVLYSTHALTGLVQGENRLKVLLCDGWYNVRKDGLAGFDRAVWRGFPRLIARITVDYADGRRETVVSDGCWTEQPNPVLFADMRVSGETVDGRLEDATAGAEARSACLAPAPGGALVPSDVPPSRVMRTLKPSAIVAVSGTTNAWNVAFPENMAGWVRLTIRGAKRGDVVTVRYDERAQVDLQPAVDDKIADRNPEDRSWRRQPRKIAAHAKMPEEGLPPGVTNLVFQQDRYVCRGDAVEVFEPRFTYKGFQYALVTGLRSAPRRDDVTACIVHTDFKTIGRFACADATLDALVAAADRSYRSNFVNGVPTDCPHREKNGWLNDAAAASEQAQFVYENTDAYVKWVRDICDAQRPSGEIMQIAPFGQPWGADGQWNGPTWDSALAVVPWNLYLYRGDTRAMTHAVPAILRYSDFMHGHVGANGLVARGLGDWLSPKTRTPLPYLASCHLMQIDALGARMAEMLGDAEGAAKLRSRAAELKRAIVSAYRLGEGRWANGSQTAQSYALAFGLVGDEAERRAAFDQLVAACEKAGRTIDCGQLGLKTVFRELARGGRLDIAVDMLTSPNQPSMAFWLARGGTTLWEDWWDGSSRNHVNYSDFVAVLYEHLAGIRLMEAPGSVSALRTVTKPGFAEVVVAPQLVPGIDRAEASVRLPQGPLAVAWRVADGRFEMTLDVPAGCRAHVVTPDGTTRDVTAGRHAFGRAPASVADRREAPAFSLRNVYGDHMVLQRGKPLRFVGTATPLGVVTVDFHGVVRTATADVRGDWAVELPAEEAGGPYELKVTPPWKGAKPYVCRDIHVGEVWVCSGQSNMEMPVWGNEPFYRLTNGQDVARAAQDPRIRLLKIPRAMDPDLPCREAPRQAVWQVATTPEAVEPFSATAWHFGQNLRRELGPDVAIGLVDASWGGSRIEPWIPRAQFEKDGDRVILDRLDLCSVEKCQGVDWAQRAVELKKQEWVALDAWLARFRAYDPERSQEAVANWSRADYDDTHWTHAPRSEMTGLLRPGIAWYRFAFDVPAEQAGKPLTFHIGFVNDADETYLDGRRIGQTQPHDVDEYWAAPRAYAFAAPAGRHVLAIRAMDHNGEGAIGGSVRVTDAAGATLADFSDGEWVEKIEFCVDPRRLEQRPPLTAGNVNPRLGFGTPTCLWNAMVAPVSAFNVRGAIWYQGCSNAGESNYDDRERQLFESWRTAFRDAAMPFVVTQLSALEEHCPARRGEPDFWKAQKPSDNLLFTALRAQQDAMSACPHTGLACTIDIGDAFDIHPKDKAEVGRRLCHEAMRVAYGRADRLPGPRCASAVREGAAVVVTVKDAGAGLAVRGGKVNPHLFALAGADGIWRWAEATLRDGRRFVVSSPDVPEPVRVRWCWNGYPPDVNVHRIGDGLPLFPFEAEVP